MRNGESVDMNTNNSWLRSRRLTGLVFLLLAGLIWLYSGDVVDMIIRDKEILLGRYSRGNFGSLFFLSLFLLGLAALCFSSLKTFGEMASVFLLVTLSTVLSVFVLVIGSGWMLKPRYVEQVIEQGEGEDRLSGLVRHRPSHEFYRLMQIDKPLQARSYPDAPAGYPAFELTLTTDANGFRNGAVGDSLLSQYDIVAVGDSFVAGSHVSDEQAWVDLLRNKMNTSIYNLGVSGSDPGNYYNNFVLLGKQYKPKHVLFMIYEGNDFKKISPLVTTGDNKSSLTKNSSNKKSLGEKLGNLAVASPVTKGLRRFSAEVLETTRSDVTVPGYAEAVGFMPIKVDTGDRPHYYGFEPKRLIYLYQEKETFRQSKSWRAIEDILQRLVLMGKEEGFQVLFLYAPSTPHVVMPLVKDTIPADQLRNFAAYEEDDLPDAETFKKNVFNWMDNEQNVFREYCAEQSMDCLVLTEALQQATAKGEQVYYSYDQHWTPEGNRVVAEAIAAHISQTNRN